MFKKMKLGLKIGMGFGLLLVIAATLGILAIFNMSNVETQSVMLQKEYVPEVDVANNVERKSFHTMYAMRGYGFTGEQAMLEDAQNELKQLHERLAQAKKLGDEAPNLKKLTPAVEKIEQMVNSYEELVDETVAVNAKMEKNKQTLDKAAALYMGNCNDYLVGQNQKMEKEIKEGLGEAALDKRLQKITIVNDIIDIGNATRIAAWKSQAEREPKIIQDANLNFPVMKEKFNILRQLSSAPEDLKRIDDTQSAADAYKTAMNTYLDNWLINRDLGEKRGQLGDKILEEAMSVSVAGMEGTVRIADAAVKSLSSASSIMIIGLIVAAFIGIAAAILITRSITKPVILGVNLAQEIAKGDFSMRLNLDRGDEIGVLANSLDEMAENLAQNAAIAEKIADGNMNVDVTLASDKDQLGLALQKMVLNLNDVLGQMQEAGEQIASGSGQVSDSAQSLSQGATQQAASLEEISASLNQLSSQTSTNAENANQANQLSSSAQQAAKQGGTQMESMVAAMAEINEAGQNISKIIKTIDEIAFQTNLLALNAAVEAARAGQHGKGFAVVAEEVRNLAARSAKAAAETSELIEGSVEKTKNGSDIAGKTAEALHEIFTGISKTSDLVAEIAAASNEQAQGVSQISQGVSQIDDVTQQNTASAEEGAAAAEELSGQAETMRQMLARFTLASGNQVQQNYRPEISVPQTSSIQSIGWGGQNNAVSIQGGALSIQWKDSLNTGIPFVDKQHRQLLDLINKLFKIMKDGGDRMLIGSVVDDLAKYTIYHFREEEKLMKKHHYPDFDAHKNIHDQFVTKVGDFAEKLKSGARVAPADIYKMLKDWLISHIENQDIAGYVPHVKKRM